MDNKYILTTGGLGYIGSHICLEINKIYPEYINIVIDKNIDYSSKNYKYLKEELNDKIVFINCDMTNLNCLESIFKKYYFDFIIHLASYKSVPESIKKPLEYYTNNIISTLNLLECMNKYESFNLIFSSSACVYGDTKTFPVTEKTTTLGKQTNPYGSTKIIIEKILEDYCNANKYFNVIILRYFNPVGAHSSGNIGDIINKNSPKNLFLIIQEIYKNNSSYKNTRQSLKIYGYDYDTKDKTCIRDFIHIEDIANAHIKSIEYFEKFNDEYNYDIFNIGTGKGYTILEVVHIFNKLTNDEINYELITRRPGDVAISYADNKKAKNILKWEPKYNIDDMIQSTINWAKKQLLDE